MPIPPFHPPVSQPATPPASVLHRVSTVPLAQVFPGLPNKADKTDKRVTRHASGRSVPVGPVVPAAALPVENPIQRVDNPTGEGISKQPVRLIPAYWRAFPAGAHNAITDVPGIRVGHRTVSRQ